jgi:hypothetical protein
VSYRRRHLSIPTKVWSDPDFTSMTSGAQLVWCALMTSPAAFKNYNRATFLGLSGVNMTGGQLDEAVAEICATKYRNVLKRRVGRPHISVHIRRKVMERDGFRCCFCGSEESLGLDHIEPFSLGGDDGVENLRVLCRSCNSRRGARV